MNTHRGLQSSLFVALFLGLALLITFSPIPAQGASGLTITPLTWNVIGLDSNSPTSGPFRFPVGARVCSSAATTDIGVNLVWDSTNSHIDLRPGSLTSITIPLLAAGACADAYFEVQVEQVAAAYDTTRRYHITATDASGTVSTPTPRELYVEHLISQNRNGITDVKLDGVSIPAGGTMDLMVGGTYTIKLYGYTATQGYNQLESFINFPNTIFQILSVSTSYTSDNSPYVPNPDADLYADACLWNNDPNSPTYRSCIGGDYKAGGSVVVTYTVKIISGAGTSQPLNGMLYDFSGSSYHYNADYTIGARIADIVSPGDVTLQKAFSPKAITPGSTSVMTFKIINPTSLTFTGVNFSDNLPAGLVVASTPAVSYSNCGAGAFSPALSGGETSIAFANGTLAPNSVCTINATVTAATAGTYVNTTGHLFIGGTVDTGNFGSDTLTVSSAPACIPNQTLAHWTVPATATNPPDLTGGVPTTKAGNVATATASFTGAGGGSLIENTSGQNDTYSWRTWGWNTTGREILFKVDTSKYSGNAVTFYARRANPGPSSITYDYSINNGASYSGATTGAVNTTFAQYTLTGLPQNSNVWVRLTASGANNNNQGADLFVDNISFTGCAIPPPPPTIAKSFSPDPIKQGATSTLTFTIANTAPANIALTGIAFTDVLPAGLSIADSSTSQCGGTLTTTAATRTIALTGGTLAAGGSCTFGVTVTGTTAGLYDNVTGFVSTNQTGTSTNYATDNLTVIAPPTLAKSFSPVSIFTGGTSTLSFIVTNPNLSNPLSGIGFTDTLPGGLTVATSGPTTTCGGSLSTTAPSTITFSGGSLAANSSCTIGVTVTGATAGTKDNTTGAVTSTEGGTGNTASASIVVREQVAAIDLTKLVSTSSVGPWTKFIGVAVGDPIFYMFRVYNSGDVALTNISVTDPTLAGTSVDPAGCNWTAFEPLAPGATAECVRGPIAAVSGSHSNTATASGMGANGHSATSAPSTATYATTGLTLAKSVTETYFLQAGDILHYSYLVTNSGFAPLLGPVTVTDNKAVVTCPPVNTVGDLDDWFDPNEQLTCTATYAVTAADVTAGSVTNSAAASAGGVTSPTDDVTVEVAKPDLRLTKDDGRTTVQPGDTVTYALTVYNDGNVALSGIVITETVPPNTTFNAANSSVSWSCANGSPAGTTCTFNVGNLAIGAHTAVNFAVTVNNPLPAGANSLVNSASVADDGTHGTDQTPNNNGATDTDTINAAPDLSITKSDGGVTVTPGGTVAYTLSYANTGNQDATGVTINETVPANTTFNAAGSTPGWACVPDNDAGSICTYTIGTVAAGASGSVTFAVTVANPLPAGVTQIANTATIADDGNNGADSNPGNNSGSDTTPVDAAPNLTLTKSDGGASTVPGGTVAYTLSYANVGNQGATGVVINETVPANTTFNAGASSAGWTCVPNNNAGSTCTYTIGNLAAGASGSVTFAVTVVTSLPAGVTQIANTGIISDDGTNGADPTPNDNAGSDTTPVSAAPDLQITKDDGGITATPGGTIAYTLSYSNVGNQDATGVVINEMVPANTTFNAGASTAGWSCANGAPAGTTCTYTVGALAAGGSGSVTFAVTVNNPPAPGVTQLSNTATIADDGLNGTDPTPGDNSDTEDTPLAASDVTVTKTADNGTISAGDTAVFKIVVTNLGPGAASNVIVSDPLPGGVVWTIDPAVAGCSIAGNVLSCTFASLDPLATVEIDISGTTSAAVCGTLVNTVTVGASNETNRDNNTASATIQVNCPDLTVTKTGNGPISAGDTASFTILATNSGAGTAYGVTINDVLPGGLTWSVDAANTTATGCAIVAGVLTCGPDTLASGASVRVTVTAVTTKDNCGVLSNSATVAATNEQNTSNNSSGNVDLEVDCPAIQIEKTTSTPTVSAGDSINYTIRVTNTGLGMARDVTVTDSLPGGLTWTIDPAVSGCSIAGGTLTCNFGSMVSGGNASVTLTATTAASNCGVLSNTASVTTSNDGAATTPTVDITVQCPNLSVTKTPDAATVSAGQTAGYTITVSNAGPGEAKGVAISDSLLGGVTWTVDAGKTTATGCSITAGVLTCGPDTLASGSSVQVHVAAATTPASCGTLSNSATATPTNGAAATSPVATIEVLCPDLTVVKTGNGPINSGGTAAFKIVVSNTGAGAAYGVTLTDNLPAGITWTINPAVTACAITGNTLACAWPTLEPNASVEINVSGTVPTGVCGALDNTVTVAATNEANTGNNSANASIMVYCPDLSITKDDGQTTVQPGDTLVYHLTVKNTGNVGVTGVVVNETVPANTTFAAASSTATWSCANGSPAGTACTFSIGSLAVGETRTLDFAVTLVNPVPAGVNDLTNTATVNDDGTHGTDPTPNDNTATDTDTVNAAPDLTITKSDGGVFADPGKVLIYTLNYANVGNQDATGVKINEKVPANTTFNAANSTAGWSCADNAPAGTTCTFTIGNLAAGASGSVTFAVNVNKKLPPNVTGITNTATISDDGTNGPDPTPENNTATIVTPTRADLKLTKTATVGTTGDRITFVIKVTNLGPATAVDVVVTDVLPDPVKYLSSTWTVGGKKGKCTAVGQAVTCKLGSLLKGQTATIQIRTKLVQFVQVFKNTASVKSLTVDPVPENNAASVLVQLGQKP